MKMGVIDYANTVSMTDLVTVIHFFFLIITPFYSP